jgi:hypothetical protein
MGDEGLKALCAGIVEQAIKDYLLILKTPRMSVDGWSKEGLEDWFQSGTFTMISDLNGDEVIKLCRREAKRNGRGKAFRRYGKTVY